MKYLMLIAVLLTGCSPSPPDDKSTPVTRVTQYTALYEVKLSDGTPCAVLVGMDGRAAMSCGWERDHAR